MEASVKKLIFILILLFAVVSFAFGAVYSVSTPAQFQGALTASQANGQDDYITVEAGTYNITSTLTYTSPDGDGGHSLEIRANGNVVLDGGSAVRIMKIDTDDDNNSVTSDSGGSILVVGLNFQYGNANRSGGGIFIHTNYTSAQLENCSFTNNRANDNGGAIYFVALDSKLLIESNTFNNNQSGSGGAIYAFTNNGDISIYNNYFNNNSSDHSGGAVIATADEGTTVFDNNMFYNNVASAGLGGAVYVTGHANIGFVFNSLYLNRANSNFGRGGGLAIGLWDNNSDARIYDNIFWNNESENEGDDLFIYTQGGINSNATVILYNNDFDVNADFNTHQSEDLYIETINNYSHSGNLMVDPTFVNPSTGDLHLRASSPMIDMGIGAPYMYMSDIDGDSRPLGSNHDIGADERLASTLVTHTVVSVPTVSEWGIIIFAILSAISAIVILRRKEQD